MSERVFDRANHRARRLLLAIPFVAALLSLGAAGAPAAAPDDLGADLYAEQCAACHGTDGNGVDDRGPSLADEGRASVDFVLRTGRMPLAEPDLHPSRGPVRFSEEEIVALVDHAGAFGDGPDIPEVDPAAGDLARGARLYQLNCAACHVASGAGAAIGGGREAPDLMASTPTEIGEAILIGPGAMPVFGTFSQEDIDSVAAYIADLQERETTAATDFGGAGPVAEGLAAWLLALLPLIALTRWIGTPHEGRDEQVEVAEEAEGDPDMSDATYRAAIVSFVVAIAGGIAAAIGYSEDTDLLGIGLAAALVGIGFGLVCWAKYLDFDEHAVQEREPLQVDAAAANELSEELRTTGSILGRRKLVLGLLGGSFASLIVGFVGPIGSLGPKPRGERGRTSWSAGSRLVTSEGVPVPAGGTTFDQLVTVFPDGHIGVDDSQVVLLRLPPEVLTERTVEGGAVEGWVAYSKICTHAGCSVGLFGIDNRTPDTLRQLVCPCHQSMFDPTDGARPSGGPATRSLPQLPLDIDDDGYLIATSDFDRVVGPVAWNEA